MCFLSCKVSSHSTRYSRLPFGVVLSSKSRTILRSLSRAAITSAGDVLLALMKLRYAVRIFEVCVWPLLESPRYE